MCVRVYISLPKGKQQTSSRSSKRYASLIHVPQVVRDTFEIHAGHVVSIMQTPRYAGKLVCFYGARFKCTLNKWLSVYSENSQIRRKIDVFLWCTFHIYAQQVIVYTANTQICRKIYVFLWCTFHMYAQQVIVYSANTQICLKIDVILWCTFHMYAEQVINCL
jgi:hypothetical protein